MSTAINFCVFFIFLSLSFEVKIVMASENQANCEFNLKKTFSNVNIEVKTDFKKNLLTMQEILVEEMRKEFEKQRMKFDQELFKMKSELIATKGLTEKFVKDEFVEHKMNIINYLNNQNALIKTFETDIKSFVKDKFAEQQKQQADIKREISEQKMFLQGLIKDEVTAQQDKFQKDIKNRFVAVCSESLPTKMQIFAENIKKEFENVQKFEEKQISVVLEAIHDSTVSSNRWSENFTCIQNCGPVTDLPNNCEEAMHSKYHTNGIYLLKGGDYGLSSHFVSCKRINEKIWTVIQRREDGSIDFYRNWTDYKFGFGNLYGELLLGLERMHAMTTKHKHELYVWMEAKNGTTAFARYDQFEIGNETEKYKLTFGNYSGTAGNSLRYKGTPYDHYGMKFSTQDSCNDNQTKRVECCTETYKGGWWYNECYWSHLNGLYFSSRKQGVDWVDFGFKLKYAEMAIRRV